MSYSTVHAKIIRLHLVLLFLLHQGLRGTRYCKFGDLHRSQSCRLPSFAFCFVVDGLVHKSTVSNHIRALARLLLLQARVNFTQINKNHKIGKQQLSRRINFEKRKKTRNHVVLFGPISSLNEAKPCLQEEKLGSNCKLGLRFHAVHWTFYSVTPSSLLTIFLVPHGPLTLLSFLRLDYQLLLPHCCWALRISRRIPALLKHRRSSRGSVRKMMQ